MQEDDPLEKSDEAGAGWRRWFHLRGALLVPFVLLPVPLTIEAPDVYGGYARHGAWFLLLAFVGGMARPAARFAGEVGLVERASNGLLRLLAGLAVARFASFGFGAVVAGVAVLASSPAEGRLLSDTALGHRPATIVAGGLLIARTLGRLKNDGGRPATVGAAAFLVTAPLIGVTILALLGARSSPLALPCTLLVVAFLWPRFASWLGAGPRRAPIWAAANVGLCLVAFLFVAVDAGSTFLGELVGRWVILGAQTAGALLLLAAVAHAARRLKARGRPAGATVWLASGVVAIAAVASVRIAGVVAAGLLALVGRAPVDAVTVPPWAAVATWVAACVVSLHGVQGGPALAQGRSRVALGWLSVLLAFVATPAFGTLGWIVTGVVCAGLLIRRSAMDVLPGRAGQAAAALALAAVGALATIGVGRSLLPFLVPATALAGLGAAAGGCVGFWALGRDLAPRSMMERTGRRLIVLVAMILPLYIVIGSVVSPGIVAVSTVAILLLWSLGRSRFGPPARLPTWAVAWLLFYAGFVAVQTFKTPPAQADCAPAAGPSAARALLDLHAEAGGYLGAAPYDVASHPATDSVVASFKRIDERNGFLEVLPRTGDAAPARMDLSREDGPFFPERLVPRSDGSGIVVQVIGDGVNGLTELHVGRDGEGNPLLTAGRQASLGWEPGNPLIDERRGHVVVTYVPNLGEDNPLLEVFDDESFEPDGRSRARPGALHMSDFVGGDPDDDRYYVPAMADLFRFPLVEINADSLAATRSAELFHPAIGIAVDARLGWIFVTNPLAGTVETWDQKTLKVLDSVHVGRFPRDVEYDRSRAVLHVGTYAGGDVVSLRVGAPGEAPLSRLRSEPVGRVLRGIGLDASSGRVFAASGCGIFELAPPEKLTAQGAAPPRL